MAKRLSLDEVQGLAAEVLAANGASDENAAATADIMTAAERDGCPSHGLFRLPGYVASLRSGRADGRAVPVVEDAGPAVVRVDAGNGFAPPALLAGRQPLIEKARAQGVALLGIRNSLHFAALWPDVEPLADQGLIAIAVVNSRSFLPPWGGRQALYGTNPMAFACPRAEGPPMVWDQASSALARGEIMIAARDGHELPPGVGSDAEGRPTTDPKAILEGGTQLPFGGYKGASIALMVELLAAGLTGGLFGFESEAEHNNDGGPSNAGECIIAVDPSRAAGNGFEARAEDLFRRILGDGEARLPGDRRHAARARSLADGVEVPDALYDKIVALKQG
ncbi:MAG: Ldh family oxidoreductase [Alphaproteobacteria bacterium]|jgi:delta1-piperideine-2-carboxylate reductase|nr:Ldh family oxidoreductase [Alphaproteobacteria bacterium]